ncbi:BQ2448_7335 [Microbotryum intermedium]|uniref:BQ2448_7335 protein n=1 Tax=Microbotryum intermedium TaxID=269621 RepID=A0A238FKT8_9BASI|nr:BQ2448_7335 [Microbotryum intermedium]
MSTLTLRQLKFQARNLYKELQYLAREYPDKNYPIQKKLHGCFSAFVGADRDKVELGIKRAEFIKKELEALYFLRKYRAMKKTYYN